MSSPEDKKCRICGYADVNNVNIFSEAHKSLVNKIRTVFPILLYKNDPLPKNICKKCIATVSFMYVDIQRVMKLQHKWIQNVRCTAPDNNYLCILNMIDMANRGTRQTIKTVLSEDIFMEWIDRVALALPTQEKPTKQLYKNLASQNTATPDNLPTLIPKTIVTNNNTTDNSCTEDGQQNCNLKVEESEGAPATNESSGKLHVIKSLLASNGCTLMTVQNRKRNCTLTVKSSTETKTRKSSSSTNNKIPTTTTVADVAIASSTLKQEPLTFQEDNTEEENIVLAKRINRQTCAKKSTNATKKKIHDKTALLASPTINNKCPLCSQAFQSVNELAIHQMTHMRLQIPRIFDRKCLSKRERRGRLIMIHDKQCLRCLNCWRIFDDNKSILTHWTMSNCDFFCQICGKEFAHAPKMLREHVPAAHGVNYRSTKMQHQRFAPLPEESDVIIDTSKRAQNAFLVETDIKASSSSTTSSCTVKNNNRKSKEKKTPSKQLDNRVPCPICSIWFQNMKARNSHMRKHKVKDKVDNTQTVVLPAQLEQKEVITPVAIKQEPKDASFESKLPTSALDTQEIPKVNEIIVKATSTTLTVPTLASDILVNIKSEPLDINDDMEQKCVVCQQDVTCGLEQHTCF